MQAGGRWGCDVRARMRRDGRPPPHFPAVVVARRPWHGLKLSRPIARKRPSSATTTSGCATSPPARRRQLTTDGVKDFGYATDNAGWTKSDRPILLWSPDSKKIATFQQDERGVGEMYLVNTKVGHPGASGVEVSAAWRQPDRDDPARCDRCRYAARRAVPDAARPSPLHALRSRRLPRQRVGRRRVVSRRLAARLRLHLARPQARSAARRRRRHRRRARRVFEETVADVLRVGQRHASTGHVCRGVQRDHLVLRARQLGPALPLRPHHRQAEEPDHQRRVERHPAAPRRREEPHALLPRRRPREGPRSLLPALLPRRLRRQESHAAHAGGRRSRRDACRRRGRYFVDTYSRPDVPPVAVRGDRTAS